MNPIFMEPDQRDWLWGLLTPAVSSSKWLTSFARDKFDALCCLYAFCKQPTFVEIYSMKVRNSKGVLFWYCTGSTSSEHCEEFSFLLTTDKYFQQNWDCRCLNTVEVWLTLPDGNWRQLWIIFIEIYLRLKKKNLHQKIDPNNHRTRAV